MFVGKSLSGLVISLLLASLTVPAATASPLDCADPIEPTRTLGVDVKVLDGRYQLGEKARFRVRVHRVVEGQDLGPVEGARVAVGVSLGDVYLIGGGWTDESGRTVVKVALRRYAPPGLADVLVHASKFIADLPCHMNYEYEYGSVEKLGFFKVVR